MRAPCFYLTAVIALTAPASTPVAEASRRADEQAIRKLWEQVVAAYNRGDARTIAQLWAQDGDAMDVDGSLFRGRAEVENLFAEIFSSSRERRASSPVTSVRFLKPDVAIVDGSYEISGRRSPAGESLPIVKGLFTFVATKKEGQWVIVALRAMRPVGAPGAPPR